MIQEIETDRPIYKGSKRRVYARFYASAEGDPDVPADPDAFALKLVDRFGTVNEYSLAQLVKEGTGVYYLDFVFDESGDWKAVVTATGNIQEVQPGKLTVYAA